MRKPAPLLFLLLLAALPTVACAPMAEEGAPQPGDSAHDASRGDARLVPDPGALNADAGKLTITMVDVGQGDGLLVQFPGGKTLLIDGGPRKTALSSYLKSQGITQADYALLTHAHVDHYTGLTGPLSLLPNDCAHRIFDPGYNRTDSVEYEAFRSAAGCRYTAVGVGQSLLLDPAVQVTVMSAYDYRLSNDDADGINNTSVVLRLSYGSFSMLFEGDAEVTAEEATWKRDPADLKSTVLKMGHHGSCTASGHSYLQAVAPQWVLISVGQGNSYGLPHCQTVAKLKGLKAAGVKWLRTDINGTITVTTDGSSYAITPGKGADSDESCPENCAAPLDF